MSSRTAIAALRGRRVWDSRGVNGTGNSEHVPERNLERGVERVVSSE